MPEVRRFILTMLPASETFGTPIASFVMGDEKQNEPVESVETESGERQPASKEDAKKAKIEAEELENKGDDAASS